MTMIDEYPVSCGGIPHLHGHIISSRGDILAIERPCYSTNRATVTMVGQDMLACESVPCLHRSIITGKGKVLRLATTLLH